METAKFSSKIGSKLIAGWSDARELPERSLQRVRDGGETALAGGRGAAAGAGVEGGKELDPSKGNTMSLTSGPQ